MTKDEWRMTNLKRAQGSRATGASAMTKDEGRKTNVKRAEGSRATGARAIEKKERGGTEAAGFFFFRRAAAQLGKSVRNRQARFALNAHGPGPAFYQLWPAILSVRGLRLRGARERCHLHHGGHLCRQRAASPEPHGGHRCRRARSPVPR